MLGVSRSLVMYTVLNITSQQRSAAVILNSSLSSPGPGRGTTLSMFLPHFLPRHSGSNGSSSSQYSEFLMEAHLIFGLDTTAPPRPVAGNMISCRIVEAHTFVKWSMYCKTIIQNTIHFYLSSQYFGSMSRFSLLFFLYTFNLIFWLWKTRRETTDLLFTRLFFLFLLSTQS